MWLNMWRCVNRLFPWLAGLNFRQLTVLHTFRSKEFIHIRDQVIFLLLPLKLDKGFQKGNFTALIIPCVKSMLWGEVCKIQCWDLRITKWQVNSRNKRLLLQLVFKNKNKGLRMLDAKQSSWPFKVTVLESWDVTRSLTKLCKRGLLPTETF